MSTRELARTAILSLSFFFILAITAFSRQPSYHIFTENGKQGVKDSSNNIVVPPMYDKVGWPDGAFTIYEGVIGYKDQGKWGLITIANKKITEPLYKAISFQNGEGYIIAVREDLATHKHYHGLINLNGKVMINFRYARLEVHNQRVIAWYPTGNNFYKVGMLDMNGKPMVPFEFVSIRPIGNLRYLAETPSGRFELFNDSGQKMIDLELDSVAGFRDGFARMWKQHRVGLLNEAAEVVVRPEFKEIRISVDRIEALPYPHWIELTSNDSSLLSFDYDSVKWITDSVLMVSANRKFWMIDRQGKAKGDTNFDAIESFVDGTSIVTVGSKKGVVQADASWLLKPEWKEIIREGEFFYTIDSRDRWRILDNYGIEKTRGFYDEIGNYEKIYFPVRRGNFWGLIQRDGEQIVNCVYDSLGRIKEDKVPVKFKGLYGIINLNENWLVAPNQWKKQPINDEIYMETLGVDSRIRRYNGEMVYFTSNRILLRENHFLEYLSNGKVWKINFDGIIQTKEVTDIIHSLPVRYSEFEDIFEESEGLIGIKKDGKFGFVDDKNRLRIANRYDGIQIYSEGYAAIKLREKWGFIDKNENIVIQPIYDWVKNYHGGISMVGQDDKYYLIDQDHNKIFTEGFSSMELTIGDRYKVKRDGSMGLVGKDGQLLVNYIYDTVEDINNGMVIVSKLGSYGVVNLQGLDVIPRIYDELVFDKIKNHFFGKKAMDWKVVKILN